MFSRRLQAAVTGKGLKIAHSFLQDFSEPTAITGEMVAFFIHRHFQLTMKVGLSIQLDCRPTLKNDLFFV